MVLRNRREIRSRTSPGERLQKAVLSRPWVQTQSFTLMAVVPPPCIILATRGRGANRHASSLRNATEETPAVTFLMGKVTGGHTKRVRESECCQMPFQWPRWQNTVTRASLSEPGAVAIDAGSRSDEALTGKSGFTLISGD